MTPSPFRGRVALAAAIIVTAGAIIGSASSLYRIGTAAEMVAPWSLPIALDLLAIGAAAAVRARHRDWLAWSALVTATAVSTVMQVADSPDDLLSRIAHGAPPMAALWAFELAMRAMRHDAAAQASATAAEPMPETAPPADPAPAPPEPEPVAAAVPQPRPPARPRTRPVATLAELTPLAERVAEALAAEGRTLSRRALQDGMKAAGRPIGTSRAGELLTHLRSRPPRRLELAEASS